MTRSRLEFRTAIPLPAFLPYLLRVRQNAVGGLLKRFLDE